MSRFSLKEATLTIRDTQVQVRELTHEERNKFAAADKFAITALVASMGTIYPPMTPAEALREPSIVIEEIAIKVLELSGISKKAAAVKE